VQPVLRAVGDFKHGGFRSPDRLNLEHLKKQAKELNRLCRNGDAQAIAGLRYALRAAAIPANTSKCC
jgi:hypothetical protein